MRYLDLSLFYCEATMPFGRELSFIENEIEGFFEEYFEILKERSDTAYSDNTYLYKPHPFFLWGTYDLGTIALMDDLSLSTRNFHPGSHLMKSTVRREYRRGGDPIIRRFSENFQYNITTGLLPIPKGTSFQKFRKELIHYVDHLLPEHKYVAVCKFKINDSLLIGNGVFLRERIYSEIFKEFEKSDLLLFEEFGWNDFSILTSSNDLQSIVKCIIKIREFSAIDIFTPSELSTISENSLAKKLYNEAGVDNNIDLVGVFSKTYASFGYHKELEAEDRDDIRLFTTWNTVPGYLSAGVNAISNCINKGLDSGINLVPGHSDFSFSDGMLTLSEYINFSKGYLLQDSKARFKYPKLISGIKTTPIFPFALDLKRSNENEDIMTFVQDYRFSDQELAAIRDDLKEIKCSKISLEKVINIYSNYNLGISNINLFSYFIELRGFLIRFQDTLHLFAKELSDSPTSKLMRSMEAWCDDFEIAFKNRYYQSDAMIEVTDFNTEFNGGIQKLLSGVFAIYNTVNSVLGMGGFDAYSLVYVSGIPLTVANKISLKLNYFHLFQPSILVSTLVKESANYFFERIGQEVKPEVSDEYDQELLQYFKENINNLHEIAEDISNFFDRDIKFPSCGSFRNYFKESFLKYLIADLVSFYYGYNGNHKLFSFWFWVNVLQTPGLYLKNGEISEVAAKKILIRKIVLNKIVGYERFENCPNKKLADAWSAYYGDVELLVRLMFSNVDSFSDWGFRVGDLARSLPYRNLFSFNKKNEYFSLSKNFDSLGIFDERIFRLEKEAISSITNSLNSALDAKFDWLHVIELSDRPTSRKKIRHNSLKGSDLIILEYYRSLVKLYKPLIKKKLERGETFTLNQNPLSEPHLARVYVQLLCQSYLELIAEMFKYNSVTLEYHNFKGGKHKDLSGSNFCIDPLGGIVFKKMEDKATHLKMRHAFFGSAIDYAERIKVFLFSQELHVAGTEHPLN